ncbi:Potassium channel [Pseudocyphellaria aurata]|nr:Potassium channel [Pseudocyphellaria aurata]
MARRLSFPVAQPITIIGWYIASILLIALVSTASAGLKLGPGESRALTQAFYYAIIAASLYFIIATLMVFNVYGAFKGHYPKEFKLTMSQRTLMLQTISFMVYMLGGAAVYARVETWKFLDAVYWANFTLLTVGIGDFTPLTHLGRALLFPYAIGGIVILGLVVGSIRSLVLERGKKKLGSRMIEKKRERLLKRINTTEEAIKLTPVSNEQQAKEVGMSERERRKEEFHLMRMIQDQASVRQKWTALLISGGAWFFLWFIGALVFFRSEKNQGWTYFQSLYFAYTSLLTIGYGDLSPTSNSGKPFFVFWSLLAVPTLTILISNMGDTVVKGIRDLTIYLGEFTVLPGEASTKDRFRHSAYKLTSGKFFTKGPLMEEPPGLLGEKNDEDREKGNKPSHAAATDKLAGALEQDELAEANAARTRGDIIDENIHMYHFLLIKELRSVLKHLDESPPRKYTYEEWAWFLRLMGEDESSHTSHRKAPIKVKKHLGDQPDLQQGQTDDRDQLQQWSWVGNRSPLMGDTEEAEWVLERLSATLEKELKRQSKSRKKGPVAKTFSSNGSSKFLEERHRSGRAERHLSS